VESICINEPHIRILSARHQERVTPFQRRSPDEQYRSTQMVLI